MPEPVTRRRADHGGPSATDAADGDALVHSIPAGAASSPGVRPFGRRRGSHHGHLNLKDMFVPIDADHFTIDESGEIAGTWTLLDTEACVRPPGQ